MRIIEPRRAGVGSAQSIYRNESMTIVNDP